MFIRIITSAVGLVVFFTLLFISESSIPITCAVSAVICVMLFEVYRSIKSHNALNFSGIISAILILGAIVFKNADINLSITVSVILYLTVMVFLHEKVEYRTVMSHCLLTYYITFFMGSLITIRVNYGVFALLFVFICAWLTDTGAYFSGVFLGKHKLIPKISPKKTVEGSIGGIIACVLSVIVYVHILKLIKVDNIIYSVIFGVVISILSQLGDLIASSIKRDCGIKDFGNLLPGHGGLTDRFDSVMFIAPMVLYFLKLI